MIGRNSRNIADVFASVKDNTFSGNLLSSEYAGVCSGGPHSFHCSCDLAPVYAGLIFWHILPWPLTIVVQAYNRILF